MMTYGGFGPIQPPMTMGCDVSAGRDASVVQTYELRQATSDDPPEKRVHTTEGECVIELVDVKVLRTDADLDAFGKDLAEP